MPLIFIDRRKAGKEKSAPNRQKLIKRIRGYVKTSSPTNIGSSGVSSNSKAANNPVKVAASALEEPWFAYGNGGDFIQVLPGNTDYDRGDVLEGPEDGDGQGGGGQGDDGEDDFIVNVASDEFLDMFFEDCELPNLENEKVTEKLDNKSQHAGFSTNGAPAQLNIIRSYKQSLGRRWALMAPHKEELEELQNKLDSIYCRIAEVGDDDESLHVKAEEIENRIAELQTKIRQLDGFDKVDLRFRKNEQKPLHTVDAVLIMIMDISGSMDQNKKLIARRWFALLYAFIKRRYGSADLIFIAHTEEAMEMNEADFFSTRVNGGTMVSPAIKLANKIVKERFDSTQTNIYVSHASDGDNWYSDNPDVVKEMIGEGRFAEKLQYFSYVEVGKNYGGQTNLWETYEKAQAKIGTRRMSMSIIDAADDCYSVFQKVFKKK